ncbi:ABC transporter permease [Cyanobium sp. Cruz-8D1]|uniref:ABC transporter permease n=1 Tax=Cyanobium sp. Cruz-8D1 TaxID=2823711 RepID=UPI0020CF5818|nr:ABC transporter permease [Cyanobium sp. Cruz-8D1]MCP9866784.1 ABC transporter permease [Cyanobium sp. Cruz-8D1]
MEEAKSRLRRLSGFEIQWRVVNALVYRELRRRVSDVQGGFLAVLLEPVGQIAVWAALRLIIRQASSVNNLNIWLFLATGVILFNLYARVAAHGLTTMEANKALFFYRRVKPIDTVLAKAIEELGLYSLAAIIVFGLVWAYLYNLVLQNLPLLVISFVLMALLAVASSLLSLVGSYYFPNLKQVLSWINRALYLASGVIYAPMDIPQFARDFLVWNPLLQCIELARKALSIDYQIPSQVTLSYPAGFALVYLSLALWCYTNNEKVLIRR